MVPVREVMTVPTKVHYTCWMSVKKVGVSTYSVQTAVCIHNYPHYPVDAHLHDQPEYAS